MLPLDPSIYSVGVSLPLFLLVSPLDSLFYSVDVSLPLFLLVSTLDLLVYSIGVLLVSALDPLLYSVGVSLPLFLDSVDLRLVVFVVRLPNMYNTLLVVRHLIPVITGSKGSLKFKVLWSTLTGY